MIVIIQQTIPMVRDTWTSLHSQLFLNKRQVITKHHNEFEYYRHISDILNSTKQIQIKSYSGYLGYFNLINLRQTPISMNFLVDMNLYPLFVHLRILTVYIYFSILFFYFLVNQEVMLNKPP